ncbi:MAG: class I SAM-dependent methyltransferase [bacterium]
METQRLAHPHVHTRKDWRERLFPRNNREKSKIIGQALCYDASHNLYSVVPNAIPPNMIYAMELGARALVDVWPFIHDRLLDIGCGNRPYSLLIDSLVSRYVGIDLPSQLEDGQTDLWVDGKSLPFRLESFDTVLLIDTVYKVPSPMHLLREANRVLKPDGHLVLMTSNAVLRDKPIYAKYTPYGLRLLAEQNGFNIQILRTKGNILPFVFNLAVQMMYRLLRRDNYIRPAKMNGRLTNVEWYDRPMIQLQKMLLKFTPQSSVLGQVAWAETEGTSSIAGRFHLGHLMVAKKIFRLNEFDY